MACIVLLTPAGRCMLRALFSQSQQLDVLSCAELRRAAGLQTLARKSQQRKVDDAGKY